jgi:hypothetical protein
LFRPQGGVPRLSLGKAQRSYAEAQSFAEAQKTRPTGPEKTEIDPAGKRRTTANSLTMWIGRLRRVLEELNSQCDRAASDEEIAGFEFARSARAFSRNTREMTDDKLAFSATLMRAGEVGAATRLIDDLEQDVRKQQAALVERANVVENAAARRRTKVTRLRLARTLTAALISAGLLTFSVAGVGLASFLSDLRDGVDSPSHPASGAALSDRGGSGRRALRSLQLPDGTRVRLTPHQFRAFKNLSANRDLSPAELERLLIELVGPRLAARLADAIAAVAAWGLDDLDSAADSLRSRFDEADATAVGPGAGAKTGDESPDEQEQGDQGHEAPQKPHDGGILDTPLDTEPAPPDPVLPGGN